MAFLCLPSFLRSYLTFLCLISSFRCHLCSLKHVVIHLFAFLLSSGAFPLCPPDQLLVLSFSLLLRHHLLNLFPKHPRIILFIFYNMPKEIKLKKCWCWNLKLVLPNSKTHFMASSYLPEDAVGDISY